MKKILFAGLGRMGFPMAGHLSANGNFDVSVYNRSSEKIQRWLNTHNGSAHNAEARYDAIVLCIGRDEDVRETLTGAPHLLSQLQAGGVVVDHTTTSANLAEEMSAAAQAQGLYFIDAPVSGGEAGAVNGQLTTMVGGDESALAKVTPVLDCYCKSITHIGTAGAGQVAKMANQLAIAGLLSGLSEALMLVEKSGIDSNKVFQAIKGGAAQSWQMDNRFETMAKREFDFGFAIDHMIKDLGYALAQAEQQGWTPEIASQVRQWYQALSSQGHSHDDTSSLVRHYESESA